MCLLTKSCNSTLTHFLLCHLLEGGVNSPTVLLKTSKTTLSFVLLKPRVVRKNCLQTLTLIEDSLTRWYSKLHCLFLRCPFPRLLFTYKRSHKLQIVVLLSVQPSFQNIVFISIRLSSGIFSIHLCLQVSLHGGSTWCLHLSFSSFFSFLCLRLVQNFFLFLGFPSFVNNSNCSLSSEVVVTPTN